MNDVDPRNTDSLVLSVASTYYYSSVPSICRTLCLMWAAGLHRRDCQLSKWLAAFLCTLHGHATRLWPVERLDRDLDGRDEALPVYLTMSTGVWCGDKNGEIDSCVSDGSGNTTQHYLIDYSLSSQQPRNITYNCCVK